MRKIWFPQQIFFGARTGIDATVQAIHKVMANIEKLRDLDHKSIRSQRFSRADRQS